MKKVCNQLIKYITLYKVLGWEEKKLLSTYYCLISLSTIGLFLWGSWYLVAQGDIGAASKISFLVVFFSFLYTVLNVLNLVISGVIALMKKTKVITSAYLFACFTSVAFTGAFSYIIFDHLEFAHVDSNVGYASYFDSNRSEYSLSDYVKIDGDWDNDEGLADEMRWQEINCERSDGYCEWLTASVQRWNSNWLSVNKSIFPISEWSETSIRAVNEGSSITEEITIYRDSCKMVYNKTPTGENILGFKADPVTLTMTDDFDCN